MQGWNVELSAMFIPGLKWFHLGQPLNILIHPMKKSILKLLKCFGNFLLKYYRKYHKNKPLVNFKDISENLVKYRSWELL